MIYNIPGAVWNLFSEKIIFMCVNKMVLFLGKCFSYTNNIFFL